MTSPTQALHDAGQSIWLDNITRTMLDDGTIQGFIDHLNVTGLTSNPSIFDKAIGTGAFDEAIRAAARAGTTSGEEIFFDLAIDDPRSQGMARVGVLVASVVAFALGSALFRLTDREHGVYRCVYCEAPARR